MKKLLFAILLFPLYSLAQNVYFDPVFGDDVSNTGLSPLSPWRTITKLNSFTGITKNSTVYFKAGTISYGGVIVNKDSLTFDTYGDGEPAVISGFTTVTLTSKGNDLYAGTIPQADYRLNMVKLNDTTGTQSRWPDEDSLDQGWKKYTSGLSTNGTTTDSSTVIGVSINPNYPGADTTSPKHVVLKSLVYTMYNLISTVKRHDSLDYKRTWSLTSGGSNKLENQPIGADGIYWTRDSLYVNKRGEFYLDSVTKRFIGKGNGVWKISTVDTGLAVGSHRGVTIRNLIITGFNLYGVFIDGGNGGNLIEHCSIIDIGGIGISCAATNNFTAQDNYVNNVLSCGIRNKSPHHSNSIIRRNTITNVGLKNGMGSFNQQDYNGISSSVYSGSQIDHNTVKFVGKSGIVFFGKNSIVEYNYVSYGDSILEDAGHLYTYHEDDTVVQGNVTVRNNFSDKLIGNTAGTKSKNRDAAHYYFDGHTDSTDVYDNTAVGSDSFAVGYAYQSNHGLGMKFRNNVSFNVNITGLALGKTDTSATSVESKGNVFYQFPLTYTPNNQRYQVIFTDRNLNGWTIIQSIQRSLNSDSNYYNRSAVQNFVANLGLSDTKYTLTNWKSATGKDLHSVTLQDSDSTMLYYNPTDKTQFYTTTWTTVDEKGVIYPAATYTLPPYTKGKLRMFYASTPPGSKGTIYGIIFK